MIAYFKLSFLFYLELISSPVESTSSPAQTSWNVDQNVEYSCSWAEEQEGETSYSTDNDSVLQEILREI